MAKHSSNRSGNSRYRSLNMDRPNERWKKPSLTLIYKAIHNLLPEALCSRVELKESSYDCCNIDTVS